MLKLNFFTYLVTFYQPLEELWAGETIAMLWSVDDKSLN